jgi:hypothetical protein
MAKNVSKVEQVKQKLVFSGLKLNGIFEVEESRRKSLKLSVFHTVGQVTIHVPAAAL